MYDRDNDVERIFNEDSREKKRTGSGVYHRASRLGYIRHGMKTPVDYLKGKEKKAYIGGGSIVEYNIYDELKNIPSLNEIEAMDFEKASALLKYVKVKHKSKDLQDHWKVSGIRMYDVLYSHGVPKSNRGGNTHRKKVDAEKEPTAVQTAISAPVPKVQVSEIKQIQTPSLFDYSKLLDELKQEKDKEIERLKQENMRLMDEVVTSQMAVTNTEKKDGFRFSLNGIFHQPGLEKRMFAILQCMEQGRNYDIRLEVQEVMDDDTAI